MEFNVDVILAVGGAVALVCVGISLIIYVYLSCKVTTQSKPTVEEISKLFEDTVKQKYPNYTYTKTTKIVPKTEAEDSTTDEEIDTLIDEIVSEEIEIDDIVSELVETCDNPDGDVTNTTTPEVSIPLLDSLDNFVFDNINMSHLYSGVYTAVHLLGIADAHKVYMVLGGNVSPEYIRPCLTYLWSKNIIGLLCDVGHPNAHNYSTMEYINTHGLQTKPYTPNLRRNLKPVLSLFKDNRTIYTSPEVTELLQSGNAYLRLLSLCILGYLRVFMSPRGTRVYVLADSLSNNVADYDYKASTAHTDRSAYRKHKGRYSLSIQKIIWEYISNKSYTESEILDACKSVYSSGRLYHHLKNMVDAGLLVRNGGHPIMYTKGSVDFKDYIISKGFTLDMLLDFSIYENVPPSGRESILQKEIREEVLCSLSKEKSISVAQLRDMIQPTSNTTFYRVLKKLTDEGVILRTRHQNSSSYKLSDTARR